MLRIMLPLPSLYPLSTRRPRTALFFLLSPPYSNGCPLQSVHALPSSFFSLPPMKEDIRGPFVSIRGSSFNGRAGFCRAGALKRTNHALPSPFFSLLPIKEVIRVHSWFFLQWTRGLLPRGRAQARRPRTTLFFLLPTPYPQIFQYDLKNLGVWLFYVG